MDSTSIRKRIFRETSLWQLLKVFESTSQKPFPAYGHAFAVLVCALSLLVPAQLLTQAGTHATYISVSDILRGMDLASGVGLSISVGALSIAIAGFAIFASGLSDDTIRLMIRKDQGQTGVSVMVYSFSSFIYVMMALLFLIFSSVAVILLFSERSVFQLMLFRMFPGAHKLIINLAFCIYISQIVFVLSILKSFVWNLYQTLLSISAIRAVEKKQPPPQQGPQ